MKLAFEGLAAADLEAIVTAIAQSPIMLRRAALEALLADWQNTRLSADVDEVVLAWLASHAPERDATTLC